MLNSDQAGLGVVPLTKSARVFQSIKIYSNIDLRYVKKSQHFSKSLDQWLCREDSVQKKKPQIWAADQIIHLFWQLMFFHLRKNNSPSFGLKFLPCSEWTPGPKKHGGFLYEIEPARTTNKASGNRF